LDRTDSLTAISSIVEQHAEEAVFLAQQRERAIRAPHYFLRDLVKLDYRLDANLDGLRLAGETGWGLCERMLADEGPAGVFTAAVVAISSGEGDRIEKVVEFGCAQPSLARGLAAALGWLPLADAEPYIDWLLAAKAPALRRVGLSAAMAHRKHPGRLLVEMIGQADSSLKARALRAVGELGLQEALDRAARFVDSADESIKAAASWSVALRSAYPEALAVMRSVAESDSPLRNKALQVAMRCMDFGEAKAWQRDLAESTDHARLAIDGAGALGDPATVNWLITRMDQPALARVAGNAFTMITGLNLAEAHLEGKPLDLFEGGPDDDPRDGRVAMDADVRLPWPDPVLIERWWNVNRDQFAAGTRHLMGKAITLEWLGEVIVKGLQPQRTAAALELAVLRPDQPLFNVAAPGFRQATLLRLPQSTWVNLPRSPVAPAQ
jgi:uncharacterized protein (TIGR02270 family)